MANRKKSGEQPSLFAGLDFAFREYRNADEQRLGPIHTLHGIGRNSSDLETEALKERFLSLVRQEGYHFAVLVRGMVEGYVSYSPTGDILVAAVSELYFPQQDSFVARLQEQQRKYLQRSPLLRRRACPCCGAS